MGQGEPYHWDFFLYKELKSNRLLNRRPLWVKTKDHKITISSEDYESTAELDWRDRYLDPLVEASKPYIEEVDWTKCQEPFTIAIPEGKIQKKYKFRKRTLTKGMIGR